MTVREAAPAYRGEGPHALWHFSEEPGITAFSPRATPTNLERGGYVWAVDTRHAPMFWFPRDCPRASFWADTTTSAQDIARFFAITPLRASLRPVLRAHAIEAGWLERLRNCRLFAYELPAESFAPDPQVGGYWLSTTTVAPLGVRPVGDLLARHAEADIELRILPSLWPLWAEVVRSTLQYSGSRLRNCATPQPGWVLPDSPA